MAVSHCVIGLSMRNTISLRSRRERFPIRVAIGAIVNAASEFINCSAIKIRLLLLLLLLQSLVSKEVSQVGTIQSNMEETLAIKIDHQ
jgi:hypothetical protein